MQPGSPFLLGVNYWPRRKAMYWWRDFDAGEVREEFAMIRTLGLTHVRIFLLWESFQPEPTTISTQALADLRTTADIAADLGLKLEPTFFTGHMSGPNWAPPWLISRRPRHPDDRPLISLHAPGLAPSPHAIFNIYTEPFVLAAEKLQLQAVCKSLADHPALFAWSLGNEPDLFCRPPTDAIGKDWIHTMADIIRHADPHHPVTIGFHTVSLDSNPGLRVDHAAAHTDFSVMHGYPIYHPLARGPLDSDWVPFTAALTAVLTGRPVLYEEFGICTWEGSGQPEQPSGYMDMRLAFDKPHRQFFASQEDAANYYTAVLPRLHHQGCLGAFAWCFADYDPALWDNPPCDKVLHERAFGLFRADGRPKPAALAIQRFAETHPTIQPPKLPNFRISPEDHYRHPWESTHALYARDLNLRVRN